MPGPRPPHHAVASPRHGLARVLSKLGLASRTVAAEWVRAGGVRVNGRLVRDPEHPVRAGVDRVEVEGAQAERAERVVLALDKPRGLVTTAADEKGRDTVYACLDDPSLPWLAPVGRLDKASEGLLLFCNDPEWAARLSAPGGPRKTYHVQVDRVPDAALLARIAAGADCHGERLAPQSVSLLRSGGKTAWLEIVLDEGRNRQIRRLLAAFDIGVLRLLRVAIGGLALGALPKGGWRVLDAGDIALLGVPGPA
jgi:23S rRNA pseudouridine2605 synthase